MSALTLEPPTQNDGTVVAPRFRSGRMGPRSPFSTLRSSAPAFQPSYVVDEASLRFDLDDSDIMFTVNEPPADGDQEPVASPATPGTYLGLLAPPADIHIEAGNIDGNAEEPGHTATSSGETYESYDPVLHSTTRVPSSELPSSEIANPTDDDTDDHEYKIKRLRQQRNHSSVSASGSPERSMPSLDDPPTAVAPAVDTPCTCMERSWDGLDSHGRFDVSIARFYVAEFGEMLETLKRSTSNQIEQLHSSRQSNDEDMCACFKTLLESTLHDIATVQSNPSFLRAKDVVKDHQLVDPQVIEPIEHHALEKAVGLAVAFRLGIEVDDAHQIASTHMALVDMLRDTVLTLSQQRAELASTDAAGIAELNA